VLDRVAGSDVRYAPQIDVRSGRLGVAFETETPSAGTLGVFSNSGMSLERSEIGDAKRVDPL